MMRNATTGSKVVVFILYFVVKLEIMNHFVDSNLVIQLKDLSSLTPSFVYQGCAKSPVSVSVFVEPAKLYFYLYLNTFENILFLLCIKSIYELVI